MERKCATEIAAGKEDILSSGQLLPAMGRAKRNAATALVPYAEEWIRNFLSQSDEEEKLVVIGWSVEPLELLHAKFKKESLLVNGSIDAVKKRARGKEFYSNPTKRILFGNEKSIGTGIDLAVASTELFIELPLNAMSFDQVKGRIDLMDLKANALSYYYMTVKGSIEEINGWKLIRRKQALSTSLDL